MSETLEDLSSTPGQPPIDVASVGPTIILHDDNSLTKAQDVLHLALAADETCIGHRTGKHSDGKPAASLAIQAQNYHSQARFVPEPGWTFAMTVPADGVLIYETDLRKWGNLVTVDNFRPIGASSLVGAEIFADYIHAGLDVPRDQSKSLARLVISGLLIGRRPVTLGIRWTALRDIRLVPQPDAEKINEVAKKVSSLFMTDVVI